MLPATGNSLSWKCWYSAAPPWAKRSRAEICLTAGAFAPRGALVFAESLHLHGAVAENLARRAVASGGCAVASVLKFPASDADVGAVRALQNFTGEVGVSVFNGLALARFVAADGASLRRDLIDVLTALGGFRCRGCG